MEGPETSEDHSSEHEISLAAYKERVLSEGQRRFGDHVSPDRPPSLTIFKKKSRCF